MISFPEKSNRGPPKNHENSLAPGRKDMVEFRRYTQQVWSKVAARQLTEQEVDQILEEFGRFLLVLADKEQGRK
jgi:hypothetical protein